MKELYRKLRQYIGDMIYARKRLDTLKEMVNVQCNDGNWNCSPGMFGMANGMIFALSILTDKRPEYLEAPAEWLDDASEEEIVQLIQAQTPPVPPANPICWSS